MTKKRLTDDQRDEICRRYKAGESSTFLGKSFGVSGAAVLQLLRKRGITRRPPPSIPMFSKDEEAVVASRYTEGESAAAISRSLGVDIGTVLNVLRRQGTPKRTMAESHRRYEADHSYFDFIDTERKAYWLGFIAADGYVNDTAGCSGAEIKISLALKDEIQLISLRSDLQSTHPIARYRIESGKGAGRDYCRFGIRSAQLAHGLSRHGIKRAKTRTLRWPDLDQSLYRHFLRGYADGDGGFYALRPKQAHHRHALSFRVTSNMHFLLSARDFMAEHASLRPVSIHEHKVSPGIGTLAWGGRLQVGRIHNLLYRDATLYLPRKREVVETHL